MVALVVRVGTLHLLLTLRTHHRQHSLGQINFTDGSLPADDAAAVLRTGFYGTPVIAFLLSPLNNLTRNLPKVAEVLVMPLVGKMRLWAHLWRGCVARARGVTAATVKMKYARAI